MPPSRTFPDSASPEHLDPCPNQPAVPPSSSTIPWRHRVKDPPDLVWWREAQNRCRWRSPDPNPWWQVERPEMDKDQNPGACWYPISFGSHQNSRKIRCSYSSPKNMVIASYSNIYHINLYIYIYIYTYVCGDPRASTGGHHLATSFPRLQAAHVIHWCPPGTGALHEGRLKPRGRAQLRPDVLQQGAGHWAVGARQGVFGADLIQQAPEKFGSGNKDMAKKQKKMWRSQEHPKTIQKHLHMILKELKVTMREVIFVRMMNWSILPGRTLWTRFNTSQGRGQEELNTNTYESIELCRWPSSRRGSNNKYDKLPARNPRNYQIGLDASPKNCKLVMVASWDLFEGLLSLPYQRLLKC